MKIALVHKRLDLKGGTERDLYRTAEGLRDLGHEVHLFCSEFGVAAPQGTKAHQIPVIPLGRTARMLSFAVRAPRLIGQTGCDVVVSFGRMIDQDVLRSGGGTHRGFLQRLIENGGIRRNLWQGMSLYHRSLLALEKRQFEPGRVKTIIAVSDEVKRDIIANYSVNPSQIAVLYNGVDADRFHPARRDEFNKSVRMRWGIPLDVSLVLFVGSGFRRKGLDRLIKLWSHPSLASVYLLVVGHDARLERYQAWAQAVAPERVIFTGRQDEIEKFYGAADIVALPALQEAFGNVVLEALSSGVPVLLSRDVGAVDLLDGRLLSGIVDRPDDPDNLAAKLLGLLESAKDPKFRQEARAVGEAHSWERHFQKLETLLFEACRRQRLQVLPDFVLQQRAGASIWLAKKYTEPGFLDRLADADRLFADASCKVIKDQRKIKVARLVVEINGKVQGVFIKRYNMYSWRHHLVSPLVKSGAFRALRGAAILRDAEIKTAVPVAAVENRRRRALDKSFFITEELAGGRTADAYWCQVLNGLKGREGMARRREFLVQLADLFRTLHEREIYHNDLKDANILVVSNWQADNLSLFLLDLEGVKRYVHLRLGRKVKNLVQINRTLGRYLRRPEKLLFLRAYMGRSFYDRKIRRHLIDTVDRESIRLDIEKTAFSARVSDSGRMRIF